MAGEDKVRTITIDSIIDGQSSYEYFASQGQYKSAYAIDPDQPAADSGANSYRASGYIRPVSSQKVDSATTLAGAPLWLTPNPKDDLVYIYDSSGSTYTLNPSNYALSALSDAGQMSNASGNGAEYYDNYVYFAKDTTVARYGPLNGTASFDGDYWDTTLGLTAMSNTTYPQHTDHPVAYPNHVQHRHNDGALYIADVLDNQGILNRIKTTKTTVEGDTDDSSSYNVLDFPYGYYPTAMESYGTDLAIALYEGNADQGTLQTRAKLNFWDTTATTSIKTIGVEFPDPIITALENVNGVLYTFSGQLGQKGTRVCAFVGGYSFQQVAFIEDTPPPFHGAVDHLLERVLSGGTSLVATGSQLPCVWGIGSKLGGNSLFNIMGASASTSSTAVTALKVIDQDGFNFQIPVIGTSDGSTHGIERQTNDYGRLEPTFRTEYYRVGRPFKVTKIRIPLAQAISSGMELQTTIYVDEEDTAYTEVTRNNSNSSGQKKIVIRPQASATGDHGFFVEFKWSGSTLMTLALPITITIEYTDDN